MDKKAKTPLLVPTVIKKTLPPWLAADVLHVSLLVALAMACAHAGFAASNLSSQRISGEVRSRRPSPH